MRCPFCAKPNTSVIDSRMVGDDGDRIRRRRQCAECNERFTTYESAQLNLPHIIKSNDERESFKEEKLRHSFLRALEKRPVEMAQVDDAIAKIMHQLQSSGEREIQSIQIGDWAMAQLRHLDQVAYVRFASVYRNFENVRAFLDEIEQLENELPPELRKNQLNLLRNDGDSD